MRNHPLHDEPYGHPNRGAPYGERLDPATLTLSTVLTGIGAGASVLGAMGAMGAIGGKPSAPTPTVSKPTTMPTPDDEAARAAKRKSLAAQSARRGRSSTILEDDTSGDLLG